MPSLLIAVSDSSWVAMVANTNVKYAFTGARLSAQETYVQQLAAAMQGGAASVTNGLSEIFVLGDQQPATVVTQLFGATDTLVYSGRPIWTSLGGDTLLDDIADAGEYLAAVLPRPAAANG